LNSSQRLAPPDGFSDYIGPLAFAGITKLPENAAGSYSDREWKRTSHNGAPEFVAGVTTTDANLIACPPAIMAADDEHGKDSPVPGTRAATS